MPATMFDTLTVAENEALYEILRDAGRTVTAIDRIAWRIYTNDGSHTAWQFYNTFFELTAELSDLRSDLSDAFQLALSNDR